jgi:hypothetical protein
MERSVRREGRSLWWARNGWVAQIIVFILFGGGVLWGTFRTGEGIARLEGRPAQVYYVQNAPIVTGLGINEHARALIESGRGEEIAAWVMREEPKCSRGLAHQLVGVALQKSIPLTYLLALVSWETGRTFDPAIDGHLSKGSTDHGLMQLNSTHFKWAIEKWGIDGIKEPGRNLDLGTGKLLECYEKSATGGLGRRWGRALIAYNGRYEKGAADYLVSVLETEERLMVSFNEIF